MARSQTLPASLLAFLLLLSCTVGGAQEIDLLVPNEDPDDAPLRLNRSQTRALLPVARKVLNGVSLRLRVAQSTPAAVQYSVRWEEGGGGLGGSTQSGVVYSTSTKPEDRVLTRQTTKDVRKAPLSILKPNEWSAPLPLAQIGGDLRGPSFLALATYIVEDVVERKRTKQTLGGMETLKLEFQLSTANGKTLKTFSESAYGLTQLKTPPPSLRPSADITVVLPLQLVVESLFRQGYMDKVGDKKNPPDADFVPALYEEFIAQATGLLGYVKARRDRVAEKFSSGPEPQKFGVVGRISGFGRRHSNLEILRLEAQTLNMLGFNGLTEDHAIYDDSAPVLPLALPENSFKRIFWADRLRDPMNYAGGQDIPEGQESPFDPNLQAGVLKMVEETIADDKIPGVQETWKLWGDEIYVSLREDIHTRPGSVRAFRTFLQEQGLQPRDVGQASWEAVTPYPLWLTNEKGKAIHAPYPDNAIDRLRYYYTYRFMSYATGKERAQGTARLAKEGTLVYTMQTPSPSWSGSALDWHDFYETGANSALVFETSNRDRRVWQWESYLADIMRSIGERHNLPRGALIKPHRGAPKQRMLAIIARGARTFQWYTYGPDYDKGDSFSSRPDLIEAVGEANRFAARAEEFLYEAKPLKPAEVAFVYPRAADIWERTGNFKGESYDDTKWMYLALRQAHIPVDILTEQQLAEGKLKEYKVLYLMGPQVRRDASARVSEWVQNGGVLWSSMASLSRAEDDEPTPSLNAMLGLGERKLEIWGSVPGYRATSLQPLVEKTVPEFAPLVLENGKATGDENFRAAVAREALDLTDLKNTQILARFADGKPAAIRHAFGKGAAYSVGAYAGSSYSRAIRLPSYDLSHDYSPAWRDLIALPALDAGVYRPVIPSDPMVEALALEKDGKRSVALINWNYRGPGAMQNLRVALPGVGKLTRVRSLQQGVLPVQGSGENLSVVVPVMNEIDLLILE